MVGPLANPRFDVCVGFWAGDGWVAGGALEQPATTPAALSRTAIRLDMEVTTGGEMAFGSEATSLSSASLLGMTGEGTHHHVCRPLGHRVVDEMASLCHVAESFPRFNAQVTPNAESP